MPDDHSPQDGPETCAPCGLHQPQRNAYFDGKMLTARDLTAEQTYLNGLRHLGHSLLDGMGTVCGLKLKSHPQEGCKSSHVVLTRGMALSCCGQEIIVPQDVTIPVLKLLQADTALQAELTGDKDLVISLCRQDKPAEMAPVLISDCCSGLGGKLASRIAEGYGFRLTAEAPAARAKQRAVLQPDLDWVHSINTGDETPSVVAVDDDENLVYVATRLASAAVIRGYDGLTNALAFSLTGWDRVDDIVASGASNWLIVAGQRAGKAALGLYARRPTHLADPLVLTKLPAPAQLALSPSTGALFALCLADDGKATLLGWSADQLASHPDTPSLSLTGSDAAETGPIRAGVRVIAISPDGRQLALLLAGQPKALRLAGVAELLGQGITGLDQMAVAIKTDVGVDVTGRYAGASALQFSYDNKLLHIAGRRSAQPGDGFYARVFLNEAGPTETGAGLQIALSPDAASYAALYLAPDERWLYISTASVRGAQGEAGGMLSVYPTEAAKQSGPATAVTTPIQSIPLNAQLSGGALRSRGQRAYLPGFETASAEANAPVRGRVMVVDIAETNILAIFESAVDGCTSCAETCSCVPLAHLSGYVYPTGANPQYPRIMEAGEAGANDASIDNLSYRPIVPSNTTLMEAILEIAARGVESGPPGPRGEDGLQGPAGSNGINGTNGTDGARGKSIAAVAFDTTNTPRLDPIAGPDSDLRLVLPQPAQPAGLRDPDDYQYVTDLSWDPAKTLSLEDLAQGALPELSLKLRRRVTNPEALFTAVPDPELPHFYFSGVLEIRVHSHHDSFKGQGGFDWQPNLTQSRSFQYSPRFEDQMRVFDGQVFVLPMQKLWDGLVNLEIIRARVEVVLHGSYLTNDEKMPFDGRELPVSDPGLAGQTGGTWRAWLDVQTNRGGN